MTILGGVPIKPFRSAKNRLAANLTLRQRRLLAEYLGKRTLGAIMDAGAEPIVLAADEEVADWAKGFGYRTLLDPGSNLNSAATAAADLASTEDRPWLMVHGDLPFIDEQAVGRALTSLASGRPALAPSPDGGTPVLGWQGRDLAFQYGPGSFHRHHYQLALHNPLVLTDPRLVFDIDRPDDLALTLRRDPDLADRLSSLTASWPPSS
ncbi:MAG: 2-phospho-L-lactate guanylyltransferase [Acidimicrobiia bacterium]